MVATMLSERGKDLGGRGRRTDDLHVGEYCEIDGLVLVACDLGVLASEDGS